MRLGSLGVRPQAGGNMLGYEWGSSWVYYFSVWSKYSFSQRNDQYVTLYCWELYIINFQHFIKYSDECRL